MLPKSRSSPSSRTACLHSPRPAVGSDAGVLGKAGRAPGSTNPQPLDPTSARVTSLPLRSPGAGSRSRSLAAGAATKQVSCSDAEPAHRLHLDGAAGSRDQPEVGLAVD